MRSLPFNKACEIEDFAHPDLVGVVRDVCAHKIAHFSPSFPEGSEHRKDWEVAMAVRALDHFGALRPDATVLGVGAGVEDTIFHLTRRVRQVVAVDRYYEPGEWQPVAPLAMLVDPELVAPFPFDTQRLVVQHMDGRSLRYPDESFDGIFSSGSIEHFGELSDVAAAAYEMGRVLKPGGVLALSTELRIAGPPGGVGWPGLTLVLAPEHVQRSIIEASGLEPVDELRTDVSEATLATPRDLTRAVTDHLQGRVAPGGPEFTQWEFPHLVLVQGGYVFTSVHLTLRKTDRYSTAGNGWAKPSDAVLRDIRAFNRRVLEVPVPADGKSPPAPAAPAPAASAAPAAAPAAAPQPSWDEHRAATAQRLAELTAHEQAFNTTLADLSARLTELDAGFAEIDAARRGVDLALATVGEHQDLMATGKGAGDDPASARTRVTGSPTSGWMSSTVTVGGDLRFSVMLDPAVPDTVASYLARGETIDQGLLALMLQLVGADDLVLDVGAHLGTFSLTAAAAGCRVVAVEAAPHNAALLRASVALNGFHRVRVVHAAASDVPGVVEFHPEGPWGRVVGPGADPASVPVPAVTLTELLFELGVGLPAFVKVDVEGSEIPAIRGMAGLLGVPTAPPVLVESNGHTLALAGTTPQALVAEMEGLGYTCYLVAPPRLLKVDSSRPQLETLVDYLALKRPPAGLDGWRIETLALEERLSRVLDDARHWNPHHRAYVARALATAEPAVTDDPAVAEALERLRGDGVEAVREAVQWWAG